MPRPALKLSAAAPWVAVVLVCAALPPASLHAALAATAATIFEAAPFFLLAELATRGAWRAALAGASCGCGTGGIPGALSLPATALAWLAFGPGVALGRLALGFALLVSRRRGRPRVSARHGDHPLERRGDTFAQLATLAPTTFAAALATQALSTGHAVFLADHRAAPLTFALGVALGIVAPCATAGVAIAAALAHSLPFAAAGVLCSTGFLPVSQLRLRRTFRAIRRTATVSAPGVGTSQSVSTLGVAPECSTSRNSLPSLLLGAALAALCARGPSGFVSPRLVPFAGAGAVLAISGAARRTSGSKFALALPAAMLGALAAGSPPPDYHADPTTLADAFAGEALDFVGVATSVRGRTTLERYAISCCRIDASPVAVRLTQALHVRDGTWVSANGILQRDGGGGFELQTARWTSIPAPGDPFTYR